MSLKHFHLFFIAVSIIMLFGFGAWGVNAYMRNDESGTILSLAILSILIAAGLIVYDIKVAQKLKALGG